MWTTVAALLLLATVVAHEAAHALALRRLGIPIVEAGLGLPLAPRIVFAPRGRRTFRLSLSPWLIAAYVQPDPKREGDIARLPYRDRTWFEGAGIVANLLIGLVAIAGVFGLRERWWLAVALLVAACGTWVFRRALCAYVLPVAGLAALVFLGQGVVLLFGEPSGPVGLARMMAVSSGETALLLAGVMSLSLAILNMAPLFPFDGGRIASTVLETVSTARVAARFRVASGAVAVCFLLYVLVGDLVWLILRGFGVTW